MRAPFLRMYSTFLKACFCHENNMLSHDLRPNPSLESNGSNNNHSNDSHKVHHCIGYKLGNREKLLQNHLSHCQTSNVTFLVSL